MAPVQSISINFHQRPIGNIILFLIGRFINHIACNGVLALSPPMYLYRKYLKRGISHALMPHIIDNNPWVLSVLKLWKAGHNDDRAVGNAQRTFPNSIFISGVWFTILFLFRNPWEMTAVGHDFQSPSWLRWRNSCQKYIMMCDWPVSQIWYGSFWYIYIILDDSWNNYIRPIDFLSVASSFLPHKMWWPLGILTQNLHEATFSFGWSIDQSRTILTLSLLLS